MSQGTDAKCEENGTGVVTYGAGHLFRKAFDDNPMGIALLDLEGHWIHVNPSFCDLFGADMQELMATDSRAILQPEDIPASRDLYRRLLNRLLPSYEVETCRPAASGPPVWLLLTVFLIQDSHLSLPYVAIHAQDITKRKSAEDKCRYNERLFRSICENAADLIVILDNEQNVLYANPIHTQLIEYSPSELTNKQWFTFLHPEDHPEAEKALTRTLSSGTESTFQIRLRHKHGTWHHMECNGRAIRCSDGQTTGIVVVSRLIDDRLRAEETLRAHEELLHLILNSTGKAIYGIDLHGNCRFCNSSCATILGYKKPSDLLGRNVHQVLHHSLHDGTSFPAEECPIDQALCSDTETHTVGDTIWRADGTCFPAEIWSYPITNNGTISGRVVTFLDISERKAADAALRAAHRQSEIFINSVPSILIGTDTTNHITRWNHAAARTFNLLESDVVGEHLLHCGIEWQPSNILAEIESCLKTNMVRRCEVPFSRGVEKRLLGLTIKPVDFGANGAVELLIIGSDITERHALEEQLRQAQKLEAIGQLAAGIAHEINTPSQYVGSNTSFLKESWIPLADFLSTSRKLLAEASVGAVSAETLARCGKCVADCDLDYLLNEIPKALEQSSDGIERIAKIVRAMKEFSHPGSQERKPLDVNRAIENALTVARHEWKYVADVRTCFDESLPLVPCFVGELNQVILNLLTNASHAIADVVGVGGTSKGTITVATKRMNNWAEIQIQDTGAGIPEEIRPRIFEPFFTTKEVGKGSGQGLALAHAIIVKKHNGRIWFETEVGKGTTFFLRLPLAKNPEN